MSVIDKNTDETYKVTPYYPLNCRYLRINAIFGLNDGVLVLQPHSMISREFSHKLSPVELLEGFTSESRILLRWVMVMPFTRGRTAFWVLCTDFGPISHNLS